ncbi:hypothetical protein ABZX90_12760 [Streptomyces sp. NPDC002935]|uniref:hypothetical protein n=1 Tax=Streptomyces sp. NPDC002935 TaxID=3154545 RepID=UPI0033B495D8
MDEWGDRARPVRQLGGQVCPLRAGTGAYGVFRPENGVSTSTRAQVLQWDDNGSADHLWGPTSR